MKYHNHQVVIRSDKTGYVRYARDQQTGVQEDVIFGNSDPDNNGKVINEPAPNGGTLYHYENGSTVCLNKDGKTTDYQRIPNGDGTSKQYHYGNNPEDNYIVEIDRNGKVTNVEALDPENVGVDCNGESAPPSWHVRCTRKDANGRDIEAGHDIGNSFQNPATIEDQHWTGNHDVRSRREYLANGTFRNPIPPEAEESNLRDIGTLPVTDTAGNRIYTYPANGTQVVKSADGKSGYVSYPRNDSTRWQKSVCFGPKPEDNYVVRNRQSADGGNFYSYENGRVVYTS